MNKLTLKLHNGRLCIWAGNVQNKITINHAREAVVSGVAAVRWDQWKTEQALKKAQLRQYAPVLAGGFAVVVSASELDRG